jgi:hypothetical protein
VESIVADKRPAALWEKEKVRDILTVRTGETGFRLQPPAKLLFPSVAEKSQISRRFEIGSCVPTSFTCFKALCNCRYPYDALQLVTDTQPLCKFTQVVFT